jgi:hypothetical protein
MRKGLLIPAIISLLPVVTSGQTEPMSAHSMKAMALHMKMTPRRPANAADSIRAAQLVKDLRTAITKYRDVRVAVDDGFKEFAPQIKNQPVYHFTNYKLALENAFGFDPSRPTSLLYKKDAAGKFVLIGAMYTAPKRFSEAQLDERVPLSVAQWHRHTNLCLPRSSSAWAKTKDGYPVFGPQGVATRAECESAGGLFMPEPFGWMVHANVFESDDPRVIWGDDHQMSGDEMMDGMSDHRH